MNITFKSTLESGYSELTEVLNSSFEDYVVPLTFTSANLADMARLDSVDMTSSKVAWHDGQAIGVALLARRGDSCRLASMAVCPRFRHQGVGLALLNKLLSEEQRRGTQDIVLEVIEGNEAAVSLYERSGFKRIQRLVGLKCEQPEGESSNDCQPISIREVGKAMVGWAPDDLPWQVSGETVIQLSSPLRGFRLSDAYAAVTLRNSSEVWIRCIVTKPSSRRQGHASRLLRSLFATFDGAQWKVAPLYPEGTMKFFKQLGFAEHQPSQIQMRLMLSSYNLDQ